MSNEKKVSTKTIIFLSIVIGVLLAIGIDSLIGGVQKHNYEKWKVEEEQRRVLIESQRDSFRILADSRLRQAETAQRVAEEFMRQSEEKYRKEIERLKEITNEKLTAIDSNDTTYLTILSRK
jgi:hypothetical protein